MQVAVTPRKAWRPITLGRELALVIGLKLAALLVLYALFFSPAHRATIDSVARITGEVSNVLR